MKERIDSINEALFNLLSRIHPSIEADSLISILITAVVATVLALIIFVLVRDITGFIEKKIHSLHPQKTRSLRFQNQEVLTGNQITWGVEKLFNWIRYFSYLIIFYLYVNSIFSLFPKTCHGIFSAQFSSSDLLSPVTTCCTRNDDGL
jgi:hypothetical protein